MRKHTTESLMAALLGRSITDPKTGCVIWTGAKSHRGYGIVGHKTSAHRFAYAQKHGEIPAGLHVLHTCDTPACINPDHLRIGTNAENIEDKARKGRAGKKLSVDAVKEIKGMIAKGVTQYSIARLFGINQSCVSDIARRKSWRFVEVEGC